jgi:ribonuclease Z
MSISYRVLGKPGWDNGLMVWVNSGTGIYRMLFDCGENILKDLDQRTIKLVDYLFFSHLHIDHVAGFDYFFRRNYDRDKKPVYVYGPEDTAEIIQNRMRGFRWNLVKGVPGLWYVTDIKEKSCSTFLFKTTEGYAVKHRIGEKPFEGTLIDNPDFTVKAVILDHITPSAAYFIKEKPSLNINKEALTETGLTPGPWLEKVRNLHISPEEEIVVDGKYMKLKSLRHTLLEKKEGESLGYLTDFKFSRETQSVVKKVFKDCNTIVCESQYLTEDIEFAEKNHHMTARQAAQLAKAAGAQKLILFHISDRYRIKDYNLLINEAREIFPDTFLPSEWKIRI